MRQIKYLELVKENVNALYSYFHASSLRCDKLQSLQHALGEPQIKLKHAIDIRWLAMYDAVVAVHNSYGSLVSTLKDDEESKQMSIKAKLVLKFVTECNFPAVTALLADVLKIVSNLSKKFQSDSIDLSAVEPSVIVAISQLKALDECPGVCLREFFESCVHEGRTVTYKGVALTCPDEQAAEFTSLKESYITNVVDALSKRLLNDSTDTLKCFGLIEPLSECNADQTALYIESLAKKFTFLDASELGKEMKSVTDLKNGCYKGYSLQAFAKAVLLRHQSDLPQTAKLCEIALCVPVSTAVCERGFNLQNWLKSKFRNCLGEKPFRI